MYMTTFMKFNWCISPFNIIVKHYPNDDAEEAPVQMTYGGPMYATLLL